MNIEEVMKTLECSQLLNSPKLLRLPGRIDLQAEKQAQFMTGPAKTCRQAVQPHTLASARCVSVVLHAGSPSRPLGSGTNIDSSGDNGFALDGVSSSISERHHAKLSNRLQKTKTYPVKPTSVSTRAIDVGNLERLT